MIVSIEEREARADAAEHVAVLGEYISRWTPGSLLTIVQIETRLFMLKQAVERLRAMNDEAEKEHLAK